MTIPQIRGMYYGDHNRKQVLVDYGFRLPSCLDNRPLNFDEFQKKIKQIIYVSATPGEFEMKNAKGEITEQIVRPTGLLDPTIQILPTKNQINSLVNVKSSFFELEGVFLFPFSSKRPFTDGCLFKFVSNKFNPKRPLELIF